MRLAKAKVNPRLKKQIDNLFCQVMADIRHPEEAREFLKSFLSKSALDIAVRRLGIAYYLNRGRTYANIKTNLVVSSATVSAMAEQMKTQGVQIALKIINANEWATKWAGKIGKMLKSGRK